MVKEIQPLSVEEVTDVQLEGGVGADGVAVDDMAEKRRQGWWCAGCCYFFYAGLFGGLIAKNTIQFVIFAVFENMLFYYFLVMIIAWALGGIVYCITGCCNAPGMAKILDPFCMFLNLGLSAWGAAVLFGNPFLTYLSGNGSLPVDTTLSPVDTARLQAGQQQVQELISTFASASQELA